MTRRELEVTDIDEILEILNRGSVINLGLWDGEYPYVVPMNYGYTYKDNHLTFYVHGATKGRKCDVIEKYPKISFAIATDVVPFDGKVACQYGTSYSCVMGKGQAKLLDNPEDKMKALTNLMKVQTDEDFEFNERMVSVVNVIQIDIEEFTAKKRPLPGTRAE